MTVMSREAVANVCTFLFHKNSPGLLQTWLMHHLALFDPTKITIIDHSTTDNDALALLRSASMQGVHVVRFVGPFREKHAELTKLMHKASSSCDFLVPLDNDEHLAVYANGHYSFSRAAVEAALLEEAQQICAPLETIPVESYC